MRYQRLSSLALLILLASCASETYYDPLDDFIELDAVTIMDAPSVDLSGISLLEQEVVTRGEYLVELLGCGTCHTNGALVGTPELGQSLAGSSIGIAFTNPLQDREPGVIFPSNITPDIETGIGRLSERRIANSIRTGQNQHGGRVNSVMPWRAYRLISDDDVNAIVRYLVSIEPVVHRVPNEVLPGQRTSERFVYFGVYERR